MIYKIFINLIATGLSSWLITKIIICCSPFFGITSIPNDRSSHTENTPNGGGLSIVISTTIFTLWLFWQHEVSYLAYWSAILLALIVAIKGLIDDIYQISPWPRLFIQFGICATLLGSLYTLPTNGLEPIDGFPAWLSIILVLLAGVWWLNLFNFMDGIDGLAASQAIFMLLGAVVLTAIKNPDLIQTTVWIWMACLAVAIFGFLVHNWFPAKVFMGDTGSMFISFMILLLALLTISLQWMNYASWAILGGIFITDASMTLFKRILTGENITEAHQKHSYQRLSRYWQSHSKVTLLTISVNICWLLPIAWLSIIIPEQSYLYLLIAYLPLIAALLYFEKT